MHNCEVEGILCILRNFASFITIPLKKSTATYYLDNPSDNFTCDLFLALIKKCLRRTQTFFESEILRNCAMNNQRAHKQYPKLRHILWICACTTVFHIFRIQIEQCAAKCSVYLHSLNCWLCHISSSFDVIAQKEAGSGRITWSKQARQMWLILCLITACSHCCSTAVFSHRTTLVTCASRLSQWRTISGKFL